MGMSHVMAASAADCMEWLPGHLHPRCRWLQTVQKRGCELEHAPFWVKHDFEIVLRAVEQDPAALGFASAQLRQDSDLLFAHTPYPVAPTPYKVVASKRFAVRGDNGVFSIRVGEATKKCFEQLSKSVSEEIVVYNPDLRSKSFCGLSQGYTKAHISRKEHPCRGHNCRHRMCRKDGSETPTGRSCWRFLFLVAFEKGSGKWGLHVSDL